MSESTQSIGWIGCGRMGTAMARRLVLAGNDVTVTNRTLSKTDALVALGAHVVGQPRDLASCDIVFIMVSANEDLLEVIGGPNGLLSDLERVPGIIVDCSTVSSDTSHEVRQACARRGAAFLAAPVSGNPKVVAAGQLTLAVSGTRDAFLATLPYFEQLGKG